MNNSLVGIFSNDVYTDRKDYGFIKLPNARTGTDGIYLWNKENKILIEIQNFLRKHKSWIVNKKVITNPGCYVSNVIDPLFLAIPFLIKHSHHFSTIDVITNSEDYPQFCFIMSSIFELNDKLELLADCKRIDNETKVYKFNEEKTLNWLKGKVDKLSTFLSEKKIVSDDSNLAVSINFKDCTETNEQYTTRVTNEAKSTAIDIVCDYISPEFEKVLKKFLNFEETPLENQVAVVSSPKLKKTKPAMADENIEAESPPKKVSRNSSKKTKSRDSSLIISSLGKLESYLFENVCSVFFSVGLDLIG